MKKTIAGLAVFQEGKTGARPFVFVHGFPYDHRMWESQVEEFGRDYLCVSYDIRGLGESPAGDGQFTMESFVDDLEAICAGLGLTRPVLCGLSMGGYISLRALERRPEAFSAAILCDTRSEADNDEGKLKRGAAIKRINAEGLASYAREFIATCFAESFRTDHSAEFRKIVDRTSRFDPVGVKGCLLAMLSRTDTTASLQKIEIPALLVCGEKDALMPPWGMREMSRKMKNAEFVEISGAGHMSPVEKPAEVNGAIRKFLEKLLARRVQPGDEG